MKLLTEAASNAKTAKNLKHKKFLTYILHLAPANLSGYNVCPAASAGCKAACLNSAGRGAFNNVQAARVKKTLRFIKQRELFLADLVHDLQAVQRKAKKLRKKAVVRLNGTSDLNWFAIKLPNGQNVFETFKDIQFYDYTKVLARLLTHKKHNVANYHLTFSRSEANETECLQAIELGFNVAVVFGQTVPTVYLNRPTIDGDGHDLRFLDAPGTVVALKAKGKAKRDASGFTVQSSCNTLTKVA